LTLNGLHGSVISQKMVLIITTAVRTSNCTVLYFADMFSPNEPFFVFCLIYLSTQTAYYCIEQASIYNQRVYSKASERSPMDGGNDGTWDLPLTAYFLPSSLLWSTTCPRCFSLVKVMLSLSLQTFIWTEWPDNWRWMWESVMVGET
jgi:hypothetical protein